MWIISIFVIIMLALAYPRWRRNLMIKRWYNTLDLDKHLTTYQQLYKDINGFALSRQARATQDAIEYTYGEIDFISFIALLSLIKPDNNTVFYDLGSGSGKAVIACAMVFDVKKSCGIEIFYTLHQSALNQQQRLQQIRGYHDKSRVIHFIHADFLQVDFSDATLVMINAAAFWGELWASLNHHLEQLAPGTVVITASKKLISDAFVIKKTTVVQMSWGKVRAYIQQRLPIIVIDNIE